MKKATPDFVRRPGAHEPYIGVRIDHPYTVQQVPCTLLHLFIPFPENFVQQHRPRLLRAESAATDELLRRITRPALREMDLRRMHPDDLNRCRQAIAVEVQRKRYNPKRKPYRPRRLSPRVTQ